MYIFEKQDDRLTKYELVYEVDKLKELKERIINKCSLITSVKEESIEKEVSEDFNYTIRNLEIKKNGSVKRNGKSVDVYLKEYDVYKYPNLVLIINEILDNQASAINKLNYYKSEHISNEYENKMYYMSKELDKVSNFDYDLKRKKLDELHQVVELAKKNENQEDTTNYYSELRSILYAKYIDEYDYTVIKDLMEFLDIKNIDYVTNLCINKVNMSLTKKLK